MAESIAAYLVEAGFASVTASGVTSALFYTAVVAASYYNAQDQKRRARNQARDAANAALEDRYVMVRGATEPRQLVLGRQRVSGPIAFVTSYGAVREKLVFVLPLAAHEVDAIEEIYFDDERLIRDGTGAVTGTTRRDTFSINAAGGTFTLRSAVRAGSASAVVEYGSTTVPLTLSITGTSATVSGATPGQIGNVVISYTPDPCPYCPTTVRNESISVVADAFGNAAATLPAGRSPTIPVSAINRHVIDGNDIDTDLSATLTVVGDVASVTGAVPGYYVNFWYGFVDNNSRARVRTFLGAPGQLADAGVVAALPGVWTTAHTMTGVAGLVIELDYDPDAFPSGLPNVSAVVRGAKVYDPRTGATAWSENPALLMRHAVLSPLCGRLPAGSVDDASVIVAANVCDTPAAYVVGGQTYNRPLYTAGHTIRSGTRGQEALDALAQAMAGRWVFVDGQMRVKAGAYSAPVMALDENWLVDAQPVQVQPRQNRADVANIITGKFSDARRDYVVLDYPSVRSSAYIAEDGAELPLDLQLDAVTFTGQAQQVAAATMRDARQGLRVSLLCNMRAYPLQVFDVVAVTLPRFGWAGKPFEVLDASWTLDGGISLTLKETDPSIWALGTSFATLDPAPNTSLRSPLEIDPIENLTVESGASVMLRQPDGTVLQRLRVSWDAMTDPAVLASGGGIEVRYGPSNVDPGAWTSVFCDGSQTEIYVPLVAYQQVYLVKARAFNRVAQGRWVTPEVHPVIGVTAQINTSGLAVDSATKVISGTLDTGVYDGSFIGTTLAGAVSFTPVRTCRAIVTAQALFIRNTPSGSGTMAFAYGASLDSPGGEITVSGTVASRLVAVDELWEMPVTSSGEVTVTGGVTYTAFMYYSQRTVRTENADMTNTKVRVELIYA